MRRPFSLMLLWFVLSVTCKYALADEDAVETASEKETKGFVFTPEMTLPCTSVKNQAKTSTCWSFATSSFIESELMRMGKGEHDLSEMFAVRYTYPKKAQRFVHARQGDVGSGQPQWGRITHLQRIRRDPPKPSMTANTPGNRDIIKRKWTPLSTTC